MPRNPGKYGKPTRGGGRHFTNFSRPDGSGGDIAPDDLNSSEEESEEDEDDSDEESSEEEEEEAGSTAKRPPAASGSAPVPNIPKDPEEIRKARQARNAQKKGVAFAGSAKKSDGDDDDEDEDEDDDQDLKNPNKGLAKNMKLADLGKAKIEPSRKDREAVEKKAAQERYWKLHQEGKTDQAKADLARLAKIKKERADAAARRQAEADLKSEQAKKALETSSKKGAARK